MNRELAVLLTALLVTAGCVSGPAPPDAGTAESNGSTARSGVETTNRIPSGYVDVSIVETVPENATTVDSTDSRIRNVSQIQEALDRAEASQGNATVSVSGSDVGEIQEALDRLPGYTGREGPSGYYVEHRDDTFVVYLAVEE